MKNKFETLCKMLLLIAIVGISMTAKANPALPNLVRTLQLADGTTVTATLVGDEFGHYWIDSNGKTYLEDGSGFFVAIDAEQVKAKAKVLRSRADAHLARRLSAPRKVGEVGHVEPLLGNRRILVILVNFSDTTFNSTQAQWRRIFNEKNYTEGNFEGSVYDYFHAQSEGKFELTFDVVGPVTVSNKQAYYGGNTNNSNNQFAGKMVREACNLVDSQVNFANYDNNGDGYVDQVVLVYAGKGESSGGGADTIWPHHHTLSGNSDGEGTLTLDGKIVDVYACSNEMNRFGNTDGIGIICHEFCHCLGFPDFYDTDHSGGQGMGYWDIMSSGDSNGNGYCPAGFTSYERWIAGWKTPVELTTTTKVTDMMPLEEGGQSYIFYNSGNNNEYYLLENRQNTGWDSSLPGEGLLILHVDYDATAWNKPNNDPNHQRITWIPADNQYQKDISGETIYYKRDGMEDDPFPYGEVNSFGPSTTPAATFYNANAEGNYYPDALVDNITQNSDRTVSFTFVKKPRLTEAYAYYNPSDNSLNFCYDKLRYMKSKTYSMNTGTNKPEWNNIKYDIKKVVFTTSQFLNYHPQSCYYWFEGMRNLTTIKNLSYLSTSECTNMAYMFSDLRKLTTLYVGNFNTTKVTDMSGMFWNCSKLETLDLSKINTSNVTNMSHMFYQCNGLNELDVSTFNTSKVTDMSAMFCGCSNLTTLNLNNFDTSNVTDMNHMFANCQKMFFVNVFNFNTSKVKHMDSMFENCTVLNSSLNVRNFNTSNVVSMDNMFYYCTTISNLDISNFTIPVGTKSMFTGCSSLKTLSVPLTADRLEPSWEVSPDIEYSEYVSYDYPFEGVGTPASPCTLIYPSGLNLEVDEVGENWYKWMEGYFISPLQAYAVINESTMTFYYDKYMNIHPGKSYGLNTGNNQPGWVSNSSSVANVVFDSSFSQARPTTCYQWFRGMDNLTTISHIERLNTSSVTSMSRMFDGCSNLTSLDLSEFNTSYVTHMDYMFNNCSKLASLEVYQFNTSEVTDMTCMFRGCSKLLVISLAGFNTANVARMNGMFENCSSLKRLYTSNINTSKVISMMNMFKGCSSLTSLDVKGFNTAKVNNMNSMFENCSSLTSLDVSNFTFVENKSENVFSGCSRLEKLFIPASANALGSTACSGVGTQYEPCSLYYPEGFTPNSISAGTNWYKWREGYFKEVDDEPYAEWNAATQTLTFHYDNLIRRRTNPVYEFSSLPTILPGWAQIPDINNNAKRVVFDENFSFCRPTLCYGLFYHMEALEEIVGLEYLNTSEVTSMRYMFENCKKLEYIDLGTFDTEKVETMSGMFYNCSSLTGINMSSFNTGNVKEMDFMFSGCSNLKSLDVSGFNTSKVESMAGMFSDCSKLPSIDVTHFNTANVSEMASMFSGCSSLKAIDLSHFSTVRTNSFGGMFCECSSLTSVDLSSFTFNGNWENEWGQAPEMFAGCTSLKCLTVPSTANLLGEHAFRNMNTETSPVALICPDGFSPTDATQHDGFFEWKGGYFKLAVTEPYAVLSTDGTTLTFYYDPNRGNYTTTFDLNTGNATPGWYNNRTSVTSVVFDSSFADARPTSCYYWFSGMTSLQSIRGIEYLKTDNVTNMSGMFLLCSELKVLDLSGFNTENVTRMGSMFSNCSSLESLDLSKFDTSKVTDMGYMFNLCSSLTSLDLSHFNTASVTFMNSMFTDCSSLTSLDLSSFTFSSNTMTSYFLYFSNHLETLTVPETAGYLYDTACSNVGSKFAPCTLVYPSGFTLQKDDTGDGWYLWKGGYFKDAGLLGDVNGDGAVTITDVSMTVGYVVGSTQAGFIKANADINGDRDINISDVMDIVQKVIN